MMKLKKGKLLIDQHNKNYLYGGKFGFIKVSGT